MKTINNLKKKKLFQFSLKFVFSNLGWPQHISRNRRTKSKCKESASNSPKLFYSPILLLSTRNIEVFLGLLLFLVLNIGTVLKQQHTVYL